MGQPVAGVRISPPPPSISLYMSYLRIITPTNLAEEKERFFSTENYSPQLRYNWDGRTIQKLEQTAPHEVKLLDAIISQDGEAITREASVFFDVKFLPEDIEFAQKLISTVPIATNGTAKEYAKLFKRKLAELGIDYKVEIVDEHGFQGRPNHKKRAMKISKHLHLQFLSLNGIVNHELVHIIRAINGQHNNTTKSADYLPTEEGLACLIQDELLAKPTPSSFQHALEYLAADLSRTAGFREIYDFLINHGCDSENAWLRGIRQKFGLKDTSQSGGLVKSGMYFYHENLLRNLSKDELVRLFVGKISLSDLPKYPHYSGVIPQEVIERVLIHSQNSQ